MLNKNQRTPVRLTRQLAPPPLPILVSRFARAELGALGRRTRYALGATRPRAIDLDELAPPDSRLAEQAADLARRLEPPFLFNHSVRSYLFGLAVGLQLGMRVDREVLYVACILHDLGLAPGHAGESSFELEGATDAHAFALEQGMEAERAALVHEAIALHTSVGIAHEREPEVALLHFGAGLDVIGFRNEDVAPSTRASIVDAWPRRDMKRAFIALIDREVAAKPSCHFVGHHRLGFCKRVAGAPFAE